MFLFFRLFQKPKACIVNYVFVFQTTSETKGEAQEQWLWLLSIVNSVHSHKSADTLGSDGSSMSHGW